MIRHMESQVTSLAIRTCSGCSGGARRSRGINALLARLLLAGVSLLDDVDARDQLVQPVDDVVDLRHFIQIAQAEGMLQVQDTIYPTAKSSL